MPLPDADGHLLGFDTPMTVTIATNPQLPTDSGALGGRLSFVVAGNFLPFDATAVLVVNAAGYQEWKQTITLAPNLPDVQMLPVAPPLPLVPTRDQLLTAQLGFGGDTLVYSGGTVPYFDVALQSLGPADRQLVYAMKRATGKNILMLALWWGYGGYPINGGRGVDFSSRWTDFKALILEAITEGFLVQVNLACEGQANNGNGQLGWSWAMTQTAEFIKTLRAPVDVTPYCRFSFGFELWGPGGDWSYGDASQQAEQAHAFLRAVLGDAGVIALEMGPGYIKWMEDGVAAWHDTMGQAIDLCLVEWPQPIEANRDGCEQITARLLGPAKRNIQGKNDGVWYLSTPTPRGPHGVSAYELGTSEWTHGRSTAAQYQAKVDYLKSLGWTVF